MVETAGKVQLTDTLLSMALNQQISSPNRILATPHTYATLAVGLPDLVSAPIYLKVGARVNLGVFLNGGQGCKGPVKNYV